MRGCMIAGTNSGCGKTTVSIGIMAALKKRGLSVAPFKAGPDYIDTGFHQKACGRESINLDLWLCGEDNIRYLYWYYSQQSDISIIEGVMGLYDGMGCQDSSYSCSHLAKELNLPVILVLDGQGLAMSAAAIIKGFKEFDQNVNIQGVIVNNVSAEGHYQLLRCIIEEKTGTKCLGYLPKNINFSLPERHLGLIPACESDILQENLRQLALTIEEHIDLELLYDLCAEPLQAEMPIRVDNFIFEHKVQFSSKTIGLAYDEAFHFYYRPNLDLIKMLGARIISFSPLKSSILPECDAVYIGGGFPEIFAEKLSLNVSFRQSLKKRLEEGVKCYAECGGLMYLCQGITDSAKKRYKMTGFIPADALMTNKLQRFGYVTVATARGNRIPAHEFHYSLLKEDIPLNYSFLVEKPVSRRQWQCGVTKKNTTAGYPHLHFWGNPQIMTELFI